MQQVLRTWLLAAVLGGAGFGQTAATLTFEAADVHVSAPAANASMRGGMLPGGRYEMHTASMVDLIRTAYGVEADAVYGGPNWLDSDRFEIIAKAPPKSSESDRAQMLKALLADRFKLVVHQEEKPLDVFTLTPGKRVLMKESEAAGDADCRPVDNASGGPRPYIVVACHNMTMPEFARLFRQIAGGYVTNPMVDMTGLKGAYDFTLKWTPRGQLRAPARGGEGETGADREANPGISFFEAVEKQLGLKLAADKRPLPVIVVDSVNRTPTENAPGIAKAIPSAPVEFDAATIKPSEPGKEGARLQPKPGGRIEIENVPTKLLVAAAWQLERDMDRVIGPKWIDSERYDIVAKTGDFKMTAPPPIDTVRVMLRALLTERFKLAAHEEDQPVQVWLMTVSKHGSKLKEADPASRSSCKPSIGEAGRGSGSVAMITYTCQNTTMAQLAEAIHNVAGGYVDHAAVDMTGLKGAYDFTITWTPRQVLLGNGRGNDRPAEAAQSSASDPSGGISFFDAIEKQLGLHLEKGKHPMPVLVIDHIEKPTTDN